ncbi:MAG: 30S ribosomal protein S19 [Parcubacteria group bacterium GW2011_GWB1_45_9]|nr:MAG: 30S ribosomal protein S19 [Parcubacteria group bacterium GW2011_GWB1_45_9]
MRPRPISNGMSRSLKKGPYVDPKLLKKIAGKKPESSAPIRTWSRDSEISPEMVGFMFEVHNGKDFISVKVSEDMIGHRLGEMAPTRKFVRHSGKIQRELEASGTTAQPAAGKAKT